MSKLLNNDKTIFIASSSLDRPQWLPVAKEIAKQGYDVVTYEADKVANGRVTLEVAIGQETGRHVKYNGKLLRLDKIASAWYLRPTIFARMQPYKVHQISLDTERQEIQNTLWYTVPKRSWLNEPESILRADRKLTQLIIAREVGFDIPDTVVSNNWNLIARSLPPKIIFKTLFGALYGDNKLKLIYTTPFDNDPAKLPLDSMPFPGLWQPYLEKVREWRITVVGDQIFDAAIYTSDDAKDDWRRHQNKKTKVQFKRETFPDDQKKKCFKYLKKFGLKFGAFDFIETKDGRITFLECNPNGQYGWLEYELGFPISGAIAGELVKIAQNT